MSGGSRKSGGSGSVAVTTPDHRKSLITLSVIGLSGTESQKGAAGVGKSVLCNRLVRPHFNDFYPNHITYLSQADYYSSIINQEHYLYWGELSLDPNDYNGPTQQIRVIEQTVFLDDESFEPLGGSKHANDYLQRATKVEFESRNKFMYIGPDQLGQENDFIAYKLDTNLIKVDVFAVLFDVSHVNGRSLAYQTSEVLQLLHAALKSKKPVFLLASKCDQAEVAAVQEFQKIVQRKDLQKYSNFHWAEVSGLENVNCAEVLYEIVKVVDKRVKPKIPSFVDSQLVRRHTLNHIKSEFKHLLYTLLPREEYPLKHGSLTWPSLLEEFAVSAHPAFVAYLSEFGANSSRQLFDEHLCHIREWWINRELAESLPALREVLRLMFNRQFLCKTSWEQLCIELEAHPQYDNYFRPFGRSLDKFSQSFDVDTRIPSELLQKSEARHLFQTFQRELLDEIALHRQTEKFKKLLDQKEAVTPGRSFADLKVMCQEFAEFEKALPANYASYVYDNYQKDLKSKATQDFNELLLENIWLFVDLVVEWRIKQSGDPNRICSLSEREYNIICSTLLEDKRYRDMNGLLQERKELIAKFASFTSMPLTCFCVAGDRCADVLISSVVSDIRYDTNKFCTIDSEVYGNETTVDEFISAVKLILSSDKLFHHNDKTAKINCLRADTSQNSLQRRGSRVRTPICVLDSIQTAENLLAQADSLFITGPTPIFLSSTPQNPIVQQMGKQLADKFNAVFIGLNTNAYSMDIPNQLMPVSSFSHEQINQVLHEICNGQAGTFYSDIRIRISFLCDDPFSISQVLSPLLEHTVQTDDAGGCFCVDVKLPEEQLNIRVCNHTGSYHHWLMSKWNLNSFNGHVLIYSPVRLASWRHAETAVQLLLEAATLAGPASSNILERQCMARSILLLAVQDPSNFFTDKDSSQLLSEGAQLAERIGCKFMAISPSMSHGAQFQLYTEFFGQLLHNQPLPNLPYTVCAQNPSNFTIKRRPTNATSTFTGSASTLLSSSSRESNLSGCAASTGPISSTVSTAYPPLSNDSQKTRHSLARKSIEPTRPETHNGPKCEQLNTNNQLAATSSHLTTSAKPNGQVRERSSSRHSTTIDSNRKTSGDSDSSHRSQFAAEMSNRLRRPLSAIGSFMSGGGLSAHPENAQVIGGNTPSVQVNASSLEGSSNSIAPVETHSNKIKFSPSGFRKLFQRSTAGSESSASDEQARKKLHRSSTVDAGSVIGGTTPSVQVSGCRMELEQASPKNAFTAYIQIDSDDASPPPKSAAKRPLRTVLKSLSMDEEAPPKSPTTLNSNGTPAVRFAPDSENIPQRTDTIVNKMQSDEYERPSRLRRFADRFTRKNRRDGPRRRQSLPSKRLDSLTTSSPTSASSNSPVDITYESECQNNDDIPTFARQCIQYIEKNGGLIIEGIYRLSGHPGLINELERQYRKTGSLCVDKLVDNSRGSRETALIAVSAALKRYLQSFNEPLIPTKLNDELLELISDRIDIDDQTPMSTRSIDAIRRLFEKNLPRVNACLLAFISAHLERVADNSERNKMTTKNLALIWAGTLFRLPPSTPIMQATNKVQKFPILVYFFIKHYTVLFF